MKPIDDRKKQRLVDLGAEALAEALLALAQRDELANDLLERLVATPSENVQRFKAKLADLKQSQRFVSWRESAGFARELETLLEDLKAGVADPKEGTELLAAFYEADRLVLNNCDDSTGHVGHVYRILAPEIFADYASRCEDKDYLLDLVLKLNRDDGFGVRGALFECAARYLPESHVRSLISRFQGMADGEGNEYSKHYCLSLIESIARQIKDAPLFEKTRTSSRGAPTADACVDIARVYLESGDAGAALSWLGRIPEKDSAHGYDRDRLLLDIHGRLGNKREQAETAWRLFRGHRCAESLQDLLAVMGEDQRDSVIAAETAAILKEETLDLSDAAFLVHLGRIDEAESYLLDRTPQLDGDSYGSLLPLAEAMEANGRAFSATAVYRALLDSILRRAQSKAYPHGARYLHKLDALAPAISDWRNMGTHDAYIEGLRQKHGRKYSFWAQYDEQR